MVWIRFSIKDKQQKLLMFFYPVQKISCTAVISATSSKKLSTTLPVAEHPNWEDI